MSNCIHAIRRGLLTITGLFYAVLSIAAPPLPQANAPIHAQQSPAIASAVGKSFIPVKPGVLTVAIAPFAPPIATFAPDTKTVIGFDPDYAKLIANTLGLKLDLQVVAWADWPLGLSSGKYDAVISNVGVTEQRKEKFDFATYRLGLHGFYVRKNSPIQSIRTPQDIAGLRVITSSGTIQEKILLEWNKQNIARGLKPIELQYYEDQNAINLALLTGRADAVLNPNSPLAWLARKEGKLRLVGTVNAGWPHQADVAIATRKNSGLAALVTAATNELIKNGSYRQIIVRWGLQAEAIPQSETNPPGLPKL